ncbi:hypothetical protein ABT173_28765 [Streptomyces sp. NPDC001795]|uniref:hypothetical protein n=1 Tax=unclassified Streptomyces TaxID=2593676 RepID=UPI0033210CA8
MEARQTAVEGVREAVMTRGRDDCRPRGTGQQEVSGQEEDGQDKFGTNAPFGPPGRRQGGEHLPYPGGVVLGEPIRLGQASGIGAAHMLFADRQGVRPEAGDVRKVVTAVIAGTSSQIT